MRGSGSGGPMEPPTGEVSRRRVIAALAGGIVPGLGCAPSAAAARGTAGRVTGNSAWRRTGDTTPEGFRRELARLRSPMLDQAEGIYRRVEGLSRLYLAMSFVEKKHDTYTDTIPQSFRNALAVKRGRGSGRWERYGSYRAGAAAWADLLLDPRGPYAATVTLRELVEVYAPAVENDVGRYVAVLTREMNRYPRLRSD
ncbi:MAG: hypothetical protein AVDCRST_MAG19-4995 [uncultured Thermomicrobiales bacterium]|uniref:Mannosyl-glycoprotein endo-beta-N-acetylglucosamidase-like domain-containing protein n=1 Tax=uncultured Thermomicrobiales bacterium TaxID=1645740 RepID=A0A6J4VRG2_9BACT|nr:MAG: hypothetical protein AVDCRST_MAG19-4995 [uncultured Thermomicrobiales bacterium]